MLKNKIKGYWNFDGDCIEYVHLFEEHCHFNNIKYQIHEHEISLHLVRSSLIYFSNVKFIPQYLIILDTIVNGIVFLNLILGCSLLVYTNISHLNVDFVFCNVAKFVYWP